MKADLYVVETGKVDDRDWSASGYAVALFLKGEYYTEQVLEEFDFDMDKEWYLITPYVECPIYYLGEKEISEELYNYLSE